MATFKLVEEMTGVGELSRDTHVVGPVRYRIDRYQGLVEGSGMPVPGLHRITGTINMDGAIPSDLVGASVTLRLDDGRTVALTLRGTDGAVLAEAHGPGGGCSCC